MARLIIGLLFICFVSLEIACETAAEAQNNFCGDQICSSLETARNLCPMDCNL